MAFQKYTHSLVEEEDGWETSPRKRLRSNSNADHLRTIREPHDLNHDHDHEHDHHGVFYAKEKASSAILGQQTVAPFLAKHVPAQYAPLGTRDNNSSQGQEPFDSNSKYCYRHRPDMLCRRQADEPTMEALQKGIEAMPQEDRQAIVQVWSLFSAAPSKQRELMLKGILAQCCFPQLSFLSANVRELIKIDFLAALPSEVSFRILCFLDTTSLCKAAQVSRRWRQLADDDVVWHRMCEQHIERKCTKCGWGLPLLDRKKLHASKREMQLRASGRGLNEWSPAISPPPEVHDTSENDDQHGNSDVEKSSDGKLSPVLRKRPSLTTSDSDYRRRRPWKDVYKDRFRVGTNWKYGRYNLQILKGHTNGVMALQITENILATGSYDAAIKIWDLDSGEEVRALKGHAMGVRCLQFDDTKLISGSLDRTLKVWNWRTGECLSTYRGHSSGVISLHFDGNLLASGSSDHTARVWNFEDKSVFCLRGHTDWINAVKIDSASRTLFTASDDCTIKLWDLDTKKCIRTYEGHVGHVQQVISLPREFDADDDPASQPMSPVSSNDTESLPVVSPPLLSESLFPFQPERPLPPRYILTSALDATIRLWETSTGRCIRTYFGHVEGVWALAADTLRIVSGAHDRTVKVWDPRSGKSEKTFAGHAGPVTCIGLSDGRMCSGGEDGEVRVYNFEA